MNAELDEIREFLDQSPDLAELSAETRSAMVRRLTLRYLRHGAPFPPEGDSDGLWIVHTGAIDLLDAGDRLHDRLGEGDVARVADGAWGSGVAGEHGRVTEDALVYHLPGPRAEDLATRHPELADFLRTPGAPVAPDGENAVMHATEGGPDALLTTPVSTLMSPQVLQGQSDISLREAARLMTDADVSALVLHTAKDPDRPAGLLTDTDLRHALAQDLPADTPVHQCMARDLVTVTGETPVFEALLEMARRDIHHLPVVEPAGGRLAGILSGTDLIRHQGTSAVHLIRDLRRAGSQEELCQHMQGLARLQVRLTEAGVDALRTAQVITLVVDTLTRCLIELAEARLGPAPAAWAWLASGSQGRHEQLAHTDQDTALIWDDGAPNDADDWFAELAREVTDGLDACGIRRCPGGVDPTHAAWRGPASTWQETFRRAFTRPDAQEARLAAHYLDLRVIHGRGDLFTPLREQALDDGCRHEAAHTAMAVQAREVRPPLGFFRRFVLEHDGEHTPALDLKKRGLLPVVALARVCALRAGADARGTLERLRAAAHAGVLDPDSTRELEEAFRFIAGVRARHQARRIAAGEAPDNHVDPTELSGLERSRLKAAFVRVDRATRAALGGEGEV
ncbi:putative nucleotidyltransferase substrate binding domain-containing protein [Thioalkalivibrio halophilus]|uniref:Cyclic nucleotide-binding protein n=1 Tax=Thioalkalivibrio halophilus TaxID=252474 RepID=A0A1V2ZWY1_9GAMM|nr:putative nucleotidyltransferase substrate binding domain-containing protein [Thioalkalivibrio halophilus]OOC09638.1 cyclic nucleotide-binding protein [Thioalkalivibrio halophilus]